MKDKMIKIRELEKRLTGFQEIPRGNVDTAYVFFQSKDNSKYAITTEKKKIMSEQLRNGKYDRIMEIQRGWFDKKIYKRISCQESGHFFSAELDVGYYIAKPEYIYQKQVYSVSAELERALSRIEDVLEENYSFKNQAELSRKMRQLVESELEKFSYLEYSLGIQVDVDDSARELLDSQRRHEVAVDRIDKEAEETKRRTKNAEELRQIKMENLGRYMNQYGTNAGDLISHVDGELSGRELSEILKADKKEQAEMNFEMIMRLYKEGIIDEQNIGGVLGKILPGMEQTLVSERIGTKQDNLDREEEYEGHKPFQWKNS